jgi:hypothetical protein
MALAGPILHAAAQGTAAQKAALQDARAHAHELSGFLLWQNRAAFEAALGRPFDEEKRGNGNVACAYPLPGTKQDYLVVFYYEGKNPDARDKAIRFELTGPDVSGDTGFFGLRLGDSSDKAEAALGKPTEIQHEREAHLELWNYARRNYSLEFTPDDELYSIRIDDRPRNYRAKPPGIADARRFAQAVLASDLETTLAMSSGDLDCSMKGKDYGLQAGAARQSLASPDSGISECLRQAAQAVMGQRMDATGAGDAIRIVTKHSPGTEMKFPASSPLKEIVFDQEGGAFRVFEVTFR